MNGSMDHKTVQQQQQGHGCSNATKGPKNYKLVVDPFIIKGTTKLYRYDGNIPNDPMHQPVIVKDPRSHLAKIWTRLETLDLPIPRFVYH